MRLAGMKECGLCCEIMAEDGHMMRTPELIELSRKMGICFITIKDLQDYIRINEKHVKQEAAVSLPTEYGNFKAYGYVSDITGEHHIALVKGEIGDGKNVLCRVHSECMTGDVFGSLRCDCGKQLSTAKPMSCRKPGWIQWTRILSWALPLTCASTGSVPRSCGISASGSSAF